MPENLQQQALEAAGMGAWSWNKETEQFSWCESVFEILELPKGNTQASIPAYADKIHPDDLATWEKSISDAMDNLTHFESYHRIQVGKDNRTIWVHEFAHPQRDTDGHAVGLIGLVRRIDREVGISSCKRQLDIQHMLDAFPFGSILEVDHDLRYVRSGGKSMLEHGLFPDKVVGKTIWEALDDQTAAALEPAYRTGLSGEPVSFEVDYSGTFYHVAITPVRDDQDNVASILVIAIDMSSLRSAEQALEQFTKNRNLIAAHLNEILILHQPNDVTQVKWVSGSAEHVLSAPLTQLHGPGLWRCIDQTDQDTYRANLRSSELNGEAHAGLLIRCHVGGTTLWLSARTFRIQNDDGTFEVASILSPAEKQLAQEREIVELQTRLDSLSLNEEIGLWEFDLISAEMTIKGTWPYAAALEASLGVTTLQKFENLLTPSSLQKFYQVLQKAQSGSEERCAATLELNTSKVNGSGWIRVSGEVLNAAGEDAPSKVFGTIVDIGEVKNSLEALELFKTAIEFAEEGIFLCSPSPREFPGPRIIYANESLCRITGYSQKELIGRSPRILRKNLPPDKVAEEILTTAFDKRPWSGQRTHFRKDGTEYRAQHSISPMLDKKGEILAFVCVEQDITQQWTLQESLRIERTNRRKLEKVKDIILSNISHELRTPMANLTTSASIIRETADEETKVWIDDLVAASNRLNQAFTSILQLVDLQSSTSFVEGSRLDVIPIVRTVVESAFEQLGEDVEGSFTSNLSHVWGELSQERLETIMLNVVDNAVRFTSSGHIQVSLSLVRDQLIVDVEDSGIGMEEDFLRKATKPFTQESEGLNREFNGLGLGLAIAEGMVSSMHGTLHISSTKGKGTTVRIALPLFYRKRTESEPRIFADRQPLRELTDSDLKYHLSDGALD